MNNFFGIYRGVCVDNEDPESLNRIRLKVPQVLYTNVTNWAYPCLPVVTNSEHPDHIAHTAAQVAALLTNHSTTITSSSVNDGGMGASSHSHTVTLNLAHVGNSGTLTHAHTDVVDPLETNGTEHTPHRKVPNISQGVWVMFEGGDPNFPVWMGVY
jgi:hypothetical protein